MFNFLKKFTNLFSPRKDDSLWPESEVIVKKTESEIEAIYPSGERLSVKLDEINKIIVETNDSGPWGADVWYIIKSPNGECNYPQGATGEKELTDYILSLKGFRMEEFFKAMSSTSNAEFICWEK